MKRKKIEIPKIVVDEGSYECPECNGINYLDSYEFTKLNHQGSMRINCPMCKTPLKLLTYEPNNY